MSKLRMPHPATMFFLLTLAVILLFMDIRCLWPERAATADWRRNTGAEPAESGGHTLAAAPCHNQFYGIRSVRLVIVAMFGIGVAQHSVSSMHVFAGGYDVHVILGALFCWSLS